MGKPQSGIISARNIRFSIIWGIAAVAGFAATHLCVAEVRHRSATATASPVILTNGSHEPISASVENNARCVTCHRFERTLTHPIQVSPVLATPDSLPLVDGQVACVTCHDASPEHRSAEVPVGQRIDGGSLCLSCHQGTPATSHGVHALATKKAHLRADSRTSMAHGTGDIDKESKTCMECHDGTLSSDAGAHTSGLSDDNSEHPIGVAMRGGSRTREGDFKLARGVDQRIRLFEGMVGCGSCHSPYSRETSQLVINNRGSALCMNCHTQ